MSNAVVSFNGDSVTVSFTFPQKWMAQRLAQVLAERAAFSSDPHRERGMWRSLSSSLTRKLANAPGQNTRYRRVKRPPSGTSVPLDVDWVVYGSAPYPVLSVTDMRIAYERLKKVRVRGEPLTVVNIARRLHVAPETVWRWERENRTRQQTRLSGRDTSSQAPAAYAEEYSTR